MNKPRNIAHLFDQVPVRLRLSLGHAIWMGLLFLAIGFGVYRVVEQSIYDSLDANLMSSAKTIKSAGLFNERRQLRDTPFWWSILDEFYGGRRLSFRSYTQVVDFSGRIVRKSRNGGVRLPVTPRALARAEKGQETFETFPKRPGNDPQFRLVTLPVVDRGKFTGELIQVGTPLDSSLRIVNHVKIMLIVSLSLALGISILFGHLLTRWAFRPVVQITNAAANFSVSDLDKRLTPPPAKDELRALIETFNEMLSRLEDVFSRLRRFAGDVSHELRTPLAVLRGEAELALRRPRSPEEYQEALRIIGSESQNMSKIVEDLLLLARAQGNSLEFKWEVMDSLTFVRGIANDLKKSFDDEQVGLEVLHDRGETLTICPGYLSLAIKNLLLNALKHSTAGSKVQFQVETSFLDITFIVRDFGQGIPEDALPYIFDAFYRADDARNRKLGGVGIGLSLAQALVKLHGGSLSVESREGHGASFKVSIPKNLEDKHFIENKKGAKPLIKSRLKYLLNGFVP